VTTVFAERTGLSTVVVCSADEPALERICDRLIGDNFKPLPAATASAASRLCRYGAAELLILDYELPRGGADELLRERTTRPDFPELGVVALVGRDQDVENLAEDPALWVDHYLRRPFTFEDLHDAMTAVLRRRHQRDDPIVRVGDLVVDPPRRKVTFGDDELRLSKKEFLLLRVLASDPTRVFSKEELLLSVWGLRSGKTRTLDSHASRLRRKLDPQHRRLVVNCWGIGYRLVDSEDEAQLPDPFGGSEGR
jgi:DNA-binding response OmpR family regulator